MQEFKPTSWAIDNKIAVFLITVLITLAGINSYNNLPKEQYPDIVVPTIFVSTIYPGVSPLDMEQLVTKPIEKKIKGINGVKKVTSSSLQDFSNIVVEFNTDVSVPEAKQKVKDAVDKSKRDLPKDLLDDPSVAELEFSEMPIMNINISGDFSLTKLKEYGELLKDDIEELKEITRADLVGALEKEVQVDLDKYKMSAASLSFNDVSNAIAYENMTISAGNVTMDGMARTVSIRGDFTDVEQIKNILVSSQSGAQLYLKDVADVRMGFEDQESFARLNGKNVITLNVIKRGGENLIEASDKIAAIVKTRKLEDFPEGLDVVVTGDQSRATRTSLNELINTIIIGFVLVTLILMFFMGATNAIFVALSVPLSMFIAFMCLPTVGFTLNMIVLFAFLLGLGIVVDDAIVVIENTHRIHEEEEPDINIAAKKAAAEVFLPVLAGTATTLAPFIPLAFWEGIMGKFMIYLPITLMITLIASLLVAYIINPVFAVQFMQREEEHEKGQKKSYKGLIISSVALLALSIIFHVNQSPAMGNFTLFMVAFLVFYRFVLIHAVNWFQKKAWPGFQELYARFLRMALGSPWLTMFAMLLVFIGSIALTTSRSPKVVFFPEADPNFVYAYLNMPVGTDISVTDSLTKELESRIFKVIGDDNPLVESVIANVALGASEDQFDAGVAANKGKVGVAFVEFAHRNGASTRDYLDKIRDAVQGIPGAEIVVAQEAAGPPTGKPVSIEIKGENFSDLIRTSTDIKRYLDSINIPGIEELRSDLIVSKPEINIKIDRERANREGISTAQIGSEFRTAILGKEASKFKDGEDEIPITVRLKKEQRENLNAVENLNLTFRDMNMGGILRSVPMAAFADVQYTNTFGGVRRKNQDRIVTLGSNVTSDANANEIVAQVTNALKVYPTPPGLTISMGGEQEEQAETASFLGGALLTSLLIIVLILVAQFNSIGKTIIILTEVIFSIIGVLLGLSIFNMDFSIMMMGVGIVTLAGIVVKNGILMVEFTDHLRAKGYEVTKAIVEAGKIRMTPVLLTASATVMGLIPLAMGFNINFETLFAHGNPHIFFGGDSVAFWGPLSWTIIFGLSFATIITLVILPVMYLLGYRFFYNVVMPVWNKIIA